MKTNYDDRIKEHIPLKNENYLVNIKDHDGVDDNGVSKKKSIVNHFNLDLPSYHIRKD